MRDITTTSSHYLNSNFVVKVTVNCKKLIEIQKEFFLSNELIRGKRRRIEDGFYISNVVIVLHYLKNYPIFNLKQSKYNIDTLLGKHSLKTCTNMNLKEIVVAFHPK